MGFAIFSGDALEKRAVAPVRACQMHDMLRWPIRSAVRLTGAIVNMVELAQGSGEDGKRSARAFSIFTTIRQRWLRGHAAIKTLQSFCMSNPPFTDGYERRP